MQEQYDFSSGVKNPYAAQLKEQATVITLDEETVAYFKSQAEATGIPYQNLIHFYLLDCAKNKRKLSWQ